MARPSLFTPETREKILSHLRNGNFRVPSVIASGVGVSTFYDWMERGKKEPDSEYGRFRNEVMEAEKVTETEIVQRVLEAGQNDPKHWIWWLERKHAERWSRDAHNIRQVMKDLAEIKERLGHVEQPLTVITPAEVEDTGEY